MARNGSGTYTNPYPNFVSGTVISSTEVDTNNSQIATALTQSIAVDGQAVVTADLPLATHKFTGMKVGTASTDSLSLGQAQAEAFVWCGTAGGSADAITLTPAPPITAYAAGQRFVWMASGVTNTTATTVAISGLGTIALQDNGAALTAGQHAASKMFIGILNTTSTVQIMQVQVSGTDPLIVTSLTVSGDATIGDDLTLLSDSSILGFGTNTDVKITHVHDSGLEFKNTSTGENTPFVLLIQTGEIDVAAENVLGKIQFQAPDEAAGTDAILVAAEIAAVSEGDFSASNNATKLAFKTGASEAATEKMSISSVGNVTMKETETSDDTPMTLLLQTGEIDIAASDVLGKIQFQAPDEAQGTDAILVAAEIAAVSEGDFSSSSNATKLSFKTGSSEAATEKMSISSVGNVTMKQTATTDDTPMTLLLQTGETDIVADDVLGKIQFQAPDEAGGTDAILVAAEIAAVSEGTFAADNNATKLSFKLGASEAATEKMSLSSGGTLELISADTGSASSPTLELTRNSASPAVSDSVGNIVFKGKDSVGGNVTYAEILTSILDETNGTEDGQLTLKVMRAGTLANAIALKENEVELNAATIDINGDVEIASTYTLNVSNIGTAALYKASSNILSGRDSGGTFADTAGAGYYVYYDADDYTRVLTYTAADGSPVWQSRSGGGTIKSEIESNGDFQSATNSYGSTSDERLKEHIEDSGSQWDDIKAMRVRKYSFITDETDGPTQLGVIAQELEASGMTGLVKTKPYMDPPADGEGPDVPVLDADGNPTDYKTVKYSVLYMKAVKALQEAMERIETLEARVLALET